MIRIINRTMRIVDTMHTIVDASNAPLRINSSQFKRRAELKNYYKNIIVYAKYGVCKTKKDILDSISKFKVISS